MKTKLVLALGAIIIMAGMMLNAASITGNPKSLTVGGINFAIAGAKIPMKNIQVLSVLRTALSLRQAAIHTSF
jgi:hypothetical protein